MNNNDNDEITISIDGRGIKAWRNKAGLYHRLDGPAREFSNGSKEWWVNGKYHRLDGPAIEYPHSYKEWWVSGIKYNSKQKFFEALTDEQKLIALMSPEFFDAK